jgi:hypothetical protein
MKKDYLNKVVNQLVGETIIDGDGVSTPFSLFIFPISSYSFLSFLYPPTYFSEFVIEVYGLTEEEVKYVWKQYRNIIKDKINEE